MNNEGRIGRVRWYSGSRGAGQVETNDGESVLALLPGAVQEDLGSVREGDAVALEPADPVHESNQDIPEACNANLFPLDLESVLDRITPSGDQI